MLRRLARPSESARDRTCPECRSTWTQRRRPSATPTVGRRSGRAVCSPGGWSRPACRVVTVNMFETVFNRMTWDCHGAAPLQHAGRLRPRAAADLRPGLLGLDRRSRAARPAGVDAGGRRGRVRPHAPDQRSRRPRPLAGRLERRRWPAAASGAGRSSASSDAARRLLPPTGPSRPRTCWPRSITAWASMARSTSLDPTASHLRSSRMASRSANCSVEPRQSACSRVV